MENNRITHCTRCNKELKDLKVLIELGIETKRKKESGIWEDIGNMKINSNEILCKDCFDLFAISLHDSMSVEKDKK